MKVTLIQAALGLLFCASSYAQEDKKIELAEKVIKMRESVEEVSSSLEMTKNDYETRIKSLGLTIVELENNIKREELKLKEIKRKQSEVKDKLQSSSNAKDSLTPGLKKSIELLKNSINESIPFKREERLAALAELDGKLNRGELSEIKVATNLWQLVEDEFRLTRENSIYQQTITLDGTEHLADVIKIGTFILYFKTKGGQVGVARNEEGVYRYTIFTDKKDKALVQELYESFKRQIRMGVFTLPGVELDQYQKPDSKSIQKEDLKS